MTTPALDRQTATAAAALETLFWGDVVARRLTVRAAVELSVELAKILPSHLHITKGSSLAN